jgi:hypothetical protein
MGNTDIGTFQSKVKFVWQPRGKGFGMSTRKCCCRYFVWDAFPEVVNYAAKGKIYDRSPTPRKRDSRQSHCPRPSSQDLVQWVVEHGTLSDTKRSFVGRWYSSSVSSRDRDKPLRRHAQNFEVQSVLFLDVSVLTQAQLTFTAG